MQCEVGGIDRGGVAIGVHTDNLVFGVGAALDDKRLVFEQIEVDELDGDAVIGQGIDQRGDTFGDAGAMEYPEILYTDLTDLIWNTPKRAARTGSNPHRDCLEHS